MAHPSTYEPSTGIERWLDSRLPLPRVMHDQFMVFPTPRNLNYWWTFGGILTFMLAVQIVTGIVLAMHYQPTVDGAFDSVEKIMRDVNWGWLLRYAHAVGASMFFLAAFIHTFRGLYYGSYKAPREVLWILGVLILLLMIGTAFMGYSLVWGQMSFWAVTVITNLFSSLDSLIPGLGTTLVQWIWGGFSVGEPTLNRLFALHYLFPFIIAGVVILHIWALHIPGSNNPTGLDVKTPKDTLPFHPYYTIKDGFALVIFLILFQEFGSARSALLTMVNLPLALIGGVFAILATGNTLNVATLVGFVTLFGIAVRNGILLVSNYNRLIDEGASLREAVYDGSMQRLNPILMTALTAALALLPWALGGGEPGKEIEAPMAIVVLGGLLTSTALNMLVVPTLVLRYGAHMRAARS